MVQEDLLEAVEAMEAVDLVTAATDLSEVVEVAAIQETEEVVVSVVLVEEADLAANKEVAVVADPSVEETLEEVPEEAAEVEAAEAEEVAEEAAKMKMPLTVNSTNTGRKAASRNKVKNTIHFLIYHYSSIGPRLTIGRISKERTS